MQKDAPMVPIKMSFVYWPSRKMFFPRFYVDYTVLKLDGEYIYYQRAGGYSLDDYIELRDKLPIYRYQIATEQQQVDRAKLYMKKTHGNLTSKFLSQYLKNLEKSQCGRQFKWLQEKIKKGEFPEKRREDDDETTDDTFVKDIMDSMKERGMYGIDVYNQNTSYNF